jgi:quinol monooxygenase YgiN
MPQVLSFTTAWVPPDQFDAILGYVAELQQLLSDVRGTRSVTVWADADLPERYGLLVHYADEDAAEIGLAKVTESQVLEEILRTSPSIPDIVRAVVWKESRFEPGNVEVGGYCSSSRRSAEPGNVQDLLNEMYDIFESLTVLDGFMGYAIAQSATLTEEVVGLVLWGNRKGFEASLPRKTLYEVKLWERIR